MTDPTTHTMRLKIDIDLKKFSVNRAIRTFIIADFVFFAGWGIVNPIFSVFVIDTIPGATLVTVGIAAAIYWIIKSLCQIPIALLLDRHEGERDEFFTLVLSLILAGVALLLFPLIQSVAALYMVMALQAFAFGLYLPAWSALFAKHLDVGHYSFDWSLDSTSVGIAAGITGLLGGAVAQFFGFTAVFIGGAALSFGSALVLITIPSILFPQKMKKEPLIRDHTPSNVNK